MIPGYKFNPFSGELFPITTAREAGAAPLACPVKQITSAGTYSLQLEDSGSVIITNDDAVISVPPFSVVPFEVGTQILIFALGDNAEDPDVQAASGVTLTPTSLSTGQVLICIGLNAWLLA
jgi:hypothetical protein